MKFEPVRLLRSSARAKASGLVGATAAVILLASACSSSAGSTSAGGAGGGGAASGGGSAASGATTVSEHSGPMGTFITDGSGKSLYMFASDSATKSTCNGACTTYWPPLTASGAVHGGSGITSAKLTTIMRSDGSKQVVYAGHPLYYYQGDGKAGDTKGQGLTDFGATWSLLTPAGAPITGSGAASSSSPSSSSSSGGSSGGGAWG